MERFSLVYGPSGCGKSSMMKAGLLPRLSADIATFYLEATPDQTESTLLGMIRKRLSAERIDRSGEELPYQTSNFSLQTSPSYQLTHDYLVPSLRDWLTRKQRETRKGRAELKLEERAATWGAKRENKQLPTLTEWLSIRALTDSKRWTDPQRAMMRSCNTKRWRWQSWVKRTKPESLWSSFKEGRSPCYRRTGAKEKGIDAKE